MRKKEDLISRSKNNSVTKVEMSGKRVNLLTLVNISMIVSMSDSIRLIFLKYSESER